MLYREAIEVVMNPEGRDDAVLIEAARIVLQYQSAYPFHYFARLALAIAREREWQRDGAEQLSVGDLAGRGIIKGTSH